MPFINVKTNAKLTAGQAEQIKTQLGQAITAIPGKSEGWLMVGIDGDQTLYFRGTADPAAMVSVSLYGSASGNAMDTLTAHITGILTDTLGIASDRIYVSYMCTEHWGWNSSNF